MVLNRVFERWEFAFLTACLLVVIEAPRTDARERPPNILVILVDDLRWDDLGCSGHPFSKTPNIDRIASEGARFLNAFSTTPLCSPSRASLLTGLYPHAHGIIDNTDRSAQSHRLATFPQALRREGYHTAFVGKWHMGNDDSPRMGFDRWVCLKGQGSTFDPELNIDGNQLKEAGYVTDILHLHALEFLKAARNKPFLLYFAHKALHPETIQRADGSLSDPNATNFIPAERHKNLYTGQPIARRPSALESPKGKPALERPLDGLPSLGPRTGSSDESILGRLRMLAAVDESLGKLLECLDQSKELGHTLVVVTSDHGYFYGEHGLSVERRLAYEEAIRVPLLMRLPGVIAPRSEPSEMVLTLDLAPSLLELGGAKTSTQFHGQSLMPLFQGNSSNWRNEILIEYFSDTVFPRINKMGYHAIRSQNWKLIHYNDLQGMDELYNLEADPFEMNNVIKEPSSQMALDQLRSKLARLLSESGGQ